MKLIHMMRLLRKSSISDTNPDTNLDTSLDTNLDTNINLKHIELV